MQVNNVSRGTAEKFPWSTDVGTHWMISIHSTGHAPANITHPFARIERFEFDDVLGDMEEHGVKTISPQQAQAIAQIIREAERENVRVLWVHCDAGICRSGAVVEAATLLGHTSDLEVSNERIPNCTVFNEVRKALGINYSWEPPNCC